jgi:hypothetical protein
MVKPDEFLDLVQAHMEAHAQVFMLFHGDIFWKESGFERRFRHFRVQAEKRRRGKT